MKPIIHKFEDESQWHALRDQHIGSSEIEALLGVEKYSTMFQLYHQKRGTIAREDLSDDLRIFWGQHLEPAIAFGLAKLHNLRIEKVRLYYTAADVPGLGASLDYKIVEEVDGVLTDIPFEIKNVDSRVAFEDWERLPGGEYRPPLHIQLQVQHQMIALGAPYAYIGALIGGNDPQFIKVEPHEKLQAMIKARVAEFWDAVASGDEPQWDAAKDLKAAQEAWKEGVIDEETIDAATMSDEFQSQVKGAMRKYAVGAQMTKDGDLLKNEAKLLLMELAGTAGEIISEWGKLNAKTNEKTKRRNALVYPKDKVLEDENNDS